MDTFQHKSCRILVLLLAVVGTVSSLSCYSCHDTGPDNRCQQHKTYDDVKDRDAETTPLKKNCTAPYNTICYIETYSDRGNEVSHIRDCGDNTTFSFTGSQLDDKKQYETLKSVGTDQNVTRCVWDGLHQVCLTKCATDFCNGPQFENSAPCIRVFGLYMYFVMAVLVFRLC